MQPEQRAEGEIQPELYTNIELMNATVPIHPLEGSKSGKLYPPLFYG